MSNFLLRCVDGGERYTTEDLIKGDFYTCPTHEPEERRSNLVFEYDLNAISASGTLNPRSLRVRTEPRSILRYSPLLPISGNDLPSLGEGWTTLYGETPDTSHLLDRLKNALDIEGIQLRAKYEGTNPTGSFKDRGMVIAVKRALEVEAKATAAGTTGNTGASAAAYSKRAGLRFYEFLPRNVASMKIAQAIAYGAEVIPFDADFDQVMAFVRSVRKRFGLQLLNSINPYRVEGQSTISYEIWEWNGYKSPDAVVVPVGNGANIGAIWRGFERLYKLKVTDKLPRMIGVQSESVAPIVDAVRRDLPDVEPIHQHYTVASAIDIGDPVNSKLALIAIRESGGTAVAVSDSQILDAQRLLIDKTGIWAEPASSATIAALPQLYRNNDINDGEKVVVILTGAGWKAPEVFEDQIKDAMKNPIPLRESALERRLYQVAA